MTTRPLTLRFLVPLTLAIALALPGCGSESAPTVEIKPVEITRSTASVIDGMLLADYPGPKAQIHYAGQSDPDFFCNTRDMMFVYLVPEALRKVNVVFVQDMGKADWDEPMGHWIDAQKAFYVAGSSRRGSMGPTLATFAVEADARSFAEEWGGEVLRFDQITIDSVMPPDDGL
ncbi:MAG TPA: nitrous oxide reductase accessory protein NosL [Azoarcus taiwanensis]|nr:nitrous oxide reductase accessory protein NosL [Azoarcus taiwanensis]